MMLHGNIVNFEGLNQSQRVAMAKFDTSAKGSDSSTVPLEFASSFFFLTVLLLV